MGQLSVPEKLRQHRQRTGSECLVDERLLPVEGFNCPNNSARGPLPFCGV